MIFWERVYELNKLEVGVLINCSSRSVTFSYSTAQFRQLWGRGEREANSVTDCSQQGLQISPLFCNATLPGLALSTLLSFTLMSCNTDNVPDDLSLISLSLACLVIDPLLSL